MIEVFRIIEDMVVMNFFLGSGLIQSVLFCILIFYVLLLRMIFIYCNLNK